MSDANPATEKLFGIEVSPKSLIAVCIDANGAVLDRFEAERFDGSDPTDRIAGFVSEGKNRFGQVSRVGIAVPGLIDREAGNVAYSANIPEHSSMDISSAVRQATGLEVTVENDANAAAYGEFKFGAGKGCKDLFYATIGKGVGGAFILNGELWRGSSGYAGEFGYIAIDSEGQRLEDVASSSNIVRRTRSRFNRDSTSSLGSLPETEIGIDDIVRAAEEGDDFARLMLERTGTYIGTAIANVINLLNIERIIIGGEITRAEHLVVDAVISRAKEFSFARSFERTQIVQGSLGADAMAIGAAILGSEV